jgi:histidine ammonia-lyase
MVKNWTNTLLPRHHGKATVNLDGNIVDRVNSSVKWLREYLAKGYDVYGLSTSQSYTSGL